MQSFRLKIYSDGVTPVVHPLSFVHPEAVLIGRDHRGRQLYRPCASLRGDFERIIVRTNHRSKGIERASQRKSRPQTSISNLRAGAWLRCGRLSLSRILTQTVRGWMPISSLQHGTRWMRCDPNR